MPSSTPAFHTTYAKLLHALLRAEGCQADAALAQAGLSAARLQQDERLVDADQMQSRVTAALRMTGRPWLGLEFGMMAQVFMHGPVGYAAVASATLRQAVAVLSRFVGLRTGALRVELETRQRDTDLIIVELIDMGPARIVVLEAVLTIIARLLQTLSGLSCTELQYQLPWPRPSWAGRYPACLAGSCHFDADRMVLRMPTALLDAPCLTADADAFAAAYQDCERRLGRAQLGTPVSDRVRSRLLRCEGNYPTLAALAEEQAMSARTLMRKLKAEQNGYQGILDQVRFERARWYLLHTDATMQAIAERLGLQDTSNFSRSFRRWSGLAPGKFRAAGRPAD